mgnify:CR=1 FL=1
MNIGLAPAGFNQSQQASRYRFTVIISVSFSDARQQKVLWENPSLSFTDEYDLASAASAQVAATSGAGAFIERLAGQIEADYRRWALFEKSARLASHSDVGVIELMPTSDGSLYSFKYVNGHPKNTAEGLLTVTAFGVLADALHHGSAQAWALGATDTIQRPFHPESILHRIRQVFPETPEDEQATDARILSTGVTAALVVMSKIFRRLPAGIPLSIDDVMEAETQILRALKRCSLRQWLIAVNKHHSKSYRHTLHVTGYAVAFAHHLGMREDDQRRLTRAALLHDVGKAFVPLPILDKKGELTDEESNILAQHTRLGYNALKEQRGFPGEVLDVVLHHHEMLDGTGYPDRLHGQQVSDIVRIMTLVDTYASLLEPDATTSAMTPEQAYGILELMGGKLDGALRLDQDLVAQGLIVLAALKRHAGRGLWTEPALLDVLPAPSFEPVQRTFDRLIPDRAALVGYVIDDDRRGVHASIIAVKAHGDVVRAVTHRALAPRIAEADPKLAGLVVLAGSTGTVGDAIGQVARMRKAQ